MIIREGQQGRRYRRNEVDGGLHAGDDKRGRWKLSRWGDYASRTRVYMKDDVNRMTMQAGQR